MNPDECDPSMELYRPFVHTWLRKKLAGALAAELHRDLWYLKTAVLEWRSHTVRCRLEDEVADVREMSRAIHHYHYIISKRAVEAWMFWHSTWALPKVIALPSLQLLCEF